jgi:Domain of unknown function (DUF4160)
VAPKIDEFAGFVVRIYSHDHGPPHVHILKGNAELRIYLDDEHPPENVRGRMKAADRRIALRIVALRRGLYLARWEEIGPR